MKIDNLDNLDKSWLRMPRPKRVRDWHNVDLPANTKQEIAKKEEQASASRLGLVCAVATRQRVLLAFSVTAGDKLLLLQGSAHESRSWWRGFDTPDCLQEQETNAIIPYISE